ncbi:hypothetical protein GGU45_001918 [Niabella hirudinis]
MYPPLFSWFKATPPHRPFKQLIDGTAKRIVEGLTMVCVFANQFLHFKAMVNGGQKRRNHKP